MGDKKIKNRRVRAMRTTFNAIVDGAHGAPYKLPHESLRACFPG